MYNRNCLAVSVSLLIFLFSVPVSAGEMIEATCSKPGDPKIMVFDFDSSGGKQNIAGIGEAEVRFSKKKIFVTASVGGLVFNLKNGNVLLNGENKGVTCKYDNLAALENKSTPERRITGVNPATDPNTSVNKQLEAIRQRLDRLESRPWEKLIRNPRATVQAPPAKSARAMPRVAVQAQTDTGPAKFPCAMKVYAAYEKPDVLFSGSIRKKDIKTLSTTGKTTVEITISGKGKNWTFSGPASYKVVGNRIELSGKHEVPAKLEELKQQFGLFMSTTCNVKYQAQTDTGPAKFPCAMKVYAAHEKPDVLFSGSIRKNDIKTLSTTGKTTVKITISGKGKNWTFSGPASYKVVGNRIDLSGKHEVPAKLGELKQQFGLFMSTTCSSR